MEERNRQKRGPLRWGILGTGTIAGKVAPAIQRTEGCVVAAVGSRSGEKAREMAGRLAWPGFEAPRAYGSYGELAADAGVDVLYVTSPHALHAEHVRLGLEAGKHVLCEKPLTLTSAQADPLIALARERGLFLMEALWTRFFPAVQRVQEIAASGELGRLCLLEASFCIQRPFDAEHRLFNPVLGGGALLDLGIYPLTLAALVLGRPESAAGTSLPSTIETAAFLRRGHTGVDEQDIIRVAYPGGDSGSGGGVDTKGGADALLTCGLRFSRPREARISGTAGTLHLPENFHHPDRFTVTLRPGTPSEESREERFPLPPRHPREPQGSPAPAGYEYEIAEAVRCLREGLTESPRMPLEESRTMLAWMDGIRRQGGVVYPGEG